MRKFGSQIFDILKGSFGPDRGIQKGDPSLDPAAILGSRCHWLNTVEFPFEGRAFNSPDGLMHYIDVGEGKPIMFLHGSPTWSFLYRKLIPELSKSFRCIAVDHLGFGLSQKPRNVDYRPAAHTRRLEAFVNHLDLRDVTIVGPDFGGPIGMEWASRNPDRYRDMVLMNSWVWSLHDNLVIRRVTQVATSGLNQYWFRLLNPSPKFYLPVLFADNHNLPTWVRDQFQLAFNNQFETYGPEGFARAMMARDGWFESVAERFSSVHKPSLLLWGEDDRTYGEDALQRLQVLLPFTATVVIPGVGNFVPEECPETCIQHIRAFIS